MPGFAGLRSPWRREGDPGHADARFCGAAVTAAARMETEIRQRLSDGLPIMRLMRSEVYEIDGARIFTVGGAASIDRAWRTPHVDWWPYEVPTERNFDEARANLDAVGWKVDYVITHTCPKSLMARTLHPSLPIPGLPDERLTRFLDEADARLDFKHWYYGHFHGDRDIDERHTLLFERIVPIGAGAGAV